MSGSTARAIRGGSEGTTSRRLARIISVADTYDVMTARDSYRAPVSSFEAIQELRRVAGKQLDANFVEIFIELLEGKDISFRHGEEADFEKELALEAQDRGDGDAASRLRRRPGRQRQELRAGLARLRLRELGADEPVPHPVAHQPRWAIPMPAEGVTL